MTSGPRMALVPTPNCPVCGGTGRVPADAMSRGGGAYLQHAAARLAISIDELMNATRAYCCTACHSYFCDPWLSPALASALFCAGAPQHHAGWTRFEGWLRDMESLRSVNRRLHAAVTRRTGPIASYGEFGCPFMGLMLHFEGQTLRPQSRAALFSRALRRAREGRPSPLARLYDSTGWMARGLVFLGLRLRIALDSAARGSRWVPAADAVEPPARRWVLTETTTKGWGSNCVRYGASCQYFAHAVLDADVIPLQEACQGGPAFDVISFVHTLDHTSFPLDVLRQVLGMARHVVIVMHPAAHAARQHLYAFGDDVAQWLTQTFAGVRVEDLSGEVDVDGREGYRYLLLTNVPA